MNFQIAFFETHSISALTSFITSSANPIRPPQQNPVELSAAQRRDPAFKSLKIPHPHQKKL